MATPGTPAGRFVIQVAAPCTGLAAWHGVLRVWRRGALRAARVVVDSDRADIGMGDGGIRQQPGPAQVRAIRLPHGVERVDRAALARSLGETNQLPSFRAAMARATTTHIGFFVVSAVRRPL